MHHVTSAQICPCPSQDGPASSPPTQRPCSAARSASLRWRRLRSPSQRYPKRRQWSQQPRLQRSRWQAHQAPQWPWRKFRLFVSSRGRKLDAFEIERKTFHVIFSLVIDESLRPLQGFSASPVDSYQHLCTRMLVWMDRHLLKYPYHLCRYLLHAQRGSKTNKGLRDAMVQHSTRGLGRAREVWECQFSDIRIEYLFT